MRTIFAAAGLFAAFAATPALAQEGDTSPGGFYAGPLVGLDDVDSGRTDHEKYGVVYGGVAGYDFAGSGAVFGLEAEVTDTTARNTGTQLVIPTDTARLSSGLDLYAGARVGFRPGAHSLIYAKAGYSRLDVKASYTAPGVNLHYKDSLGGVRVGLGVEFGLTPNLALRTELRYSDYDDPKTPGANVGFDVDRQQAVTALLFKF